MPYCRINTILLCFALSVSLHLRAQNPVSYQAEAEYGFLFLHSQDVAPIGQSYPSAFGLSVQRWLLAEKHWENCFCYPRLGLSLAIHDFDNPEVAPGTARLTGRRFIKSHVALDGGDVVRTVEILGCGVAMCAVAANGLKEIFKPSRTNHPELHQIFLPIVKDFMSDIWSNETGGPWH